MERGAQNDGDGHCFSNNAVRRGHSLLYSALMDADQSVVKMLERMRRCGNERFHNKEVCCTTC